MLKITQSLATHLPKAGIQKIIPLKRYENSKDNLPSP